MTQTAELSTMREALWAHGCHSPTEYFLNTELTQYTRGKTGKSLQQISTWLAQYYVTNNSKQSINSKSKTRPVTLLFTSNNLAESAQWQSRTIQKFSTSSKSCINVRMFNSKASADYSSYDNLNSALFSANEEERPHIIIMCCNKQRLIRDIIKLLKNCQEMARLTSFRYEFDFLFDESDEAGNLNKIIQFIKEKKILELYNIRRILLLTATPENLLEKLKTCDITELKNPDLNLICEDRDILNGQYRTIANHPKIEFVGPSSPLDYIEEVYNQQLIKTSSPGIPYTIFVPGSTYTCSHCEIAYYFNQKGFWSLVINGKQKAFLRPDGGEIPIQTFNQECHLDDNIELRDTLRKWREIFPNENLAITGYNCIRRGITLNTDGFNFTHLIMSDYYLRHHNELIQLIGRASGHREYVDPITIIASPTVFQVRLDYEEAMFRIKSQTPETYCLDNFKKERNLSTQILSQSSEETEHYQQEFLSVMAADASQTISIAKECTQLCGNTFRKKGREFIKGQIFYKDSLNTNKTDIRSTQEAIQRLSKNLNRRYNKDKITKIAKTTSLWAYDEPPIHNNGGNSDSLRILVPIPYHLYENATEENKRIYQKIIDLLKTYSGLVTKDSCQSVREIKKPAGA